MLLLFDIDGTLLLRAHVEHRLALSEAVREVWGAEDPGAPAIVAAGRTDIEIAREICLLGGVSAAHFDDGRDPFREACARAYDRLAPPDLRDRLAPQVAAVLADLADRPGVRLSLVTGNLEAVARMKLERSGLARYFSPPARAAFGSDSEDRSELPAMARRRAGDGSALSARARPSSSATPRTTSPARTRRRALRRGHDRPLRRRRPAPRRPRSSPGSTSSRR